MSVAKMIEDAMSGYDDELEEVESYDGELSPDKASKHGEPSSTQTSQLPQEEDGDGTYLREGSTGGPV